MSPKEESEIIGDTLKELVAIKTRLTDLQVKTKKYAQSFTAIANVLDSTLVFSDIEQQIESIPTPDELKSHIEEVRATVTKRGELLTLMNNFGVPVSDY